jgi:hypothetical protein
VPKDLAVIALQMELFQNIQPYYYTVSQSGIKWEIEQQNAD